MTEADKRYNTSEKRRVCQRRWYAAHPEHRTKRAKHAREYRASNPCRVLLIKAKARAKRAGIEFLLTEKDVNIPTTCPVLGIPIVFGVNGRAAAGSPSIDRIDPSKGYIPGNVMVISWRANTLKNDASASELRKIADYIDAFLRLN